MIRLALWTETSVAKCDNFERLRTWENVNFSFGNTQMKIEAQITKCQEKNYETLWLAFQQREFNEIRKIKMYLLVLKYPDFLWYNFFLIFCFRTKVSKWFWKISGGFESIVYKENVFYYLLKHHRVLKAQVLVEKVSPFCFLYANEHRSKNKTQKYNNIRNLVLWKTKYSLQINELR